MTDPGVKKLVPHCLISEVLSSGVKAILIHDTIKGGGEASYSPGLELIVWRRGIDLKVAAEKLADSLEIDVSEKEVYTLLLLHELSHHLARKEGRKASEIECDIFAKKRFSEMRGWERKFNIQVNIDISQIIKQGICEVLAGR